MHGGSLRIFACHADNEKYSVRQSVENWLEKERDAGLYELPAYLNFSGRVQKVKFDLLSCLIELKRRGKIIAAYGAAAKGNTLLNYCGIREEFITCAADRNPYKQNTLLQGSRILVYYCGIIFRQDCSF